MTKDKADSPKKGGKMKKLLLIGVGAAVLIGAGAGAGIYMGGGLAAAEAPKPEDFYPKLVLRGESGAEPAGEGEEAAPKVGTVSVPNDRYKVDPRKYEITYVPIEQAFTTNLADGSAFLQVGISLATYYDGRMVANIQRQMTPIRSAVLMVLAEQDPAQLSTSQGKQMLQRRLTAAVNQVLRDKEGFGGVDNVYFTSMVIQ